MLDAAAARIDEEGIPGAGVAPGSPEASHRAGQLREADLAKALSQGQAMDTWVRLISAQGGNPHADLPWATDTHEVLAQENGYVTGMDALKVGVAAWRLGAGRTRKEDPVQAGAGVVLHAKPGDAIQKGQKLMTLHTDTPERFERGLQALKGAWTIGSTPPPKPGVVLERIER
jgi:thymidine phosphorylase